MATWFTADQHFGHERIIELCDRPFSSVEHMNAELIRRWNEMVEDGDTVYVLGDLALGTIAETVPLTSQLRGNKILVPGNHDRCWQGNPRVRPIDIERYITAGFTIIDGPLTLIRDRKSDRSNGLDWLLCHFPYAGDSQDDDRYLDHRPENKGQWLIHGHVHNEWLVKDRQINVGVDQWDYRPASSAQIRTLILTAQAIERQGRPVLFRHGTHY